MTRSLQRTEKSPTRAGTANRMETATLLSEPVQPAQGCDWPLGPCWYRPTHVNVCLSRHYGSIIRSSTRPVRERDLAYHHAWQIVPERLRLDARHTAWVATVAHGRAAQP